MEWLNPMTAIYAAAVSVPLLLLMYFLRLKRRQQVVSSTLLWRRAVQDLQVNAPFQKIRNSILLLLQLLALLMILLAIAGPVLSLDTSPAKRYVILIDNSASMNTREPLQDSVAVTVGGAAGVADSVKVSGNNSGNLTVQKITRFEQARRKAREFIKSLRDKSSFSWQGKSDEAMVIAFNSGSKVMCNFTSDKKQLISAVDAILPGDGGSSLSQAVMVARAYAQPAGTENNNRTAVIPARLILFSDGKISDLDKIVVNPDEIEYHRIGSSGDNIAVVAMQARRDYVQPQNVEVFAKLANYIPRKVSCDVQFSINGNVRAVKRVVIAAARRKSKKQGIANSTGEFANGIKGAPNGNVAESSAGDTLTAGESKDGGWGLEPAMASVTFSLTQPDGGVLEVRQLRADSLPDDDAAWYVINPPGKLAVLLVTSGNTALESAMRACGLAKLKVCSPATFARMDASVLSVEQPYDVIVIDGNAPGKLPRGRYLIFGEAPRSAGIKYTELVKNQFMIDWRSQHPVLRYVDLSNFFAAKAYKMVLPREAQVLAEMSDTPAIVLLYHNDSVFLLADFDIMDTNWPFSPGFVVFCYNSISFLAEQADKANQANIGVNQPIVVKDIAAGTKVNLVGPGGLRQSMVVADNKTLRFAQTHRVGLYSMQVPGGVSRIWAVNLLDERESNIKPLAELKFSGKDVVKSREGGLQKSNVVLWPWLIGLCLVIMLIEWLVYNKKVKL